MTRARLIAWIPAWARTTVRVIRSSDSRQDWIYEMRRRRNGEPALPAGPIRRVIVICHGNICRSPFAGAELALRNRSLQVRSAGVEAREGKSAEPFACRTARELGVDLTDHRAHRFDAEDIEWADLIVAMQGRHVAAIRRRWPGAERSVRLLGDFLLSEPHAIEDPWGQEAAVFSSVFERIVQANERLSELLRSKGEKINT